MGTKRPRPPRNLGHRNKLVAALIAQRMQVLHLCHACHLPAPALLPSVNANDPAEGRRHDAIAEVERLLYAERKHP